METKMITGAVIVVATAELMERCLNKSFRNRTCLSLYHRTNYRHRTICIRY